MHSAAPALSALLSLRLDAIFILVLTLAACVFCRRYVTHRRPEQEFSRLVCLLAVSIAIVGAGIAEWTTAVATEITTPSTLQTIVALRAIALSAAGALVATLLTSSTVIALQRAELRERAATADQLQIARKNADQANRAKGDFLAVMSHEIRTPLNAVIGFANLLAETKLDDIQRGYLATVTGEGKRLSSLVNDILDLSKIEEGRLTLERLPFAPVETAHEVLRLFRARAAEKKLELRFEAHLSSPLMISGDPLRFRQVLVNLVDNAIKFTPQGSVTLFLTWRAPPSIAVQGQLGLCVKDTGIGIQADRQKDLFQMFMQADPSTSRRFGGTGLGLAICQRLVTLMGGQILVVSAPSEGTEFSFTLPVSPVALPENIEPTPSPAPFPVRHKPRVLVVDDLESNRFLLEQVLTRNGFEPLLATGGEEAVRITKACRVDAILMDLHMPDLELDGYGAAQRIRAAEPPGTRTPIIALTASIGNGTKEKCLAAGMDDFLTKPMDPQKFTAILRRILPEKCDPLSARTSPTFPSLPV